MVPCDIQPTTTCQEVSDWSVNALAIITDTNTINAENALVLVIKQLANLSTVLTAGWNVKVVKVVAGLLVSALFIMWASTSDNTYHINVDASSITSYTDADFANAQAMWKIFESGSITVKNKNRDIVFKEPENRVGHTANILALSALADQYNNNLWVKVREDPVGVFSDCTAQLFKQVTDNAKWLAGLIPSGRTIDKLDGNSDAGKQQAVQYAKSGTLGTNDTSWYELPFYVFWITFLESMNETYFCAACALLLSNFLNLVRTGLSLTPTMLEGIGLILALGLSWYGMQSTVPLGDSTIFKDEWKPVQHPDVARLETVSTAVFWMFSGTHEPDNHDKVVYDSSYLWYVLKNVAEVVGVAYCVVANTDILKALKHSWAPYSSSFFGISKAIMAYQYASKHAEAVRSTIKIAAFMCAIGGATYAAHLLGSDNVSKPEWLDALKICSVFSYFEPNARRILLGSLNAEPVLRGFDVIYRPETLTILDLHYVPFVMTARGLLLHWTKQQQDVYSQLCLLPGTYPTYANPDTSLRCNKYLEYMKYPNEARDVYYTYNFATNANIYRLQYNDKQHYAIASSENRKFYLNWIVTCDKWHLSKYKTDCSNLGQNEDLQANLQALVRVAPPKDGTQGHVWYTVPNMPIQHAILM